MPSLRSHGVGSSDPRQQATIFARTTCALSPPSTTRCGSTARISVFVRTRMRPLAASSRRWFRPAAAEVATAVHERDVGVGELRERERDLDRAVAAADDDDAVARIASRIVDLIDDVWQVIARHAETSGRSAPADREHHAMRGHPLVLGLDDQAVVDRSDRGDLRVFGDRQLRLLHDRLEQLEQRLLRRAAQLDLADAGQIHRRRHHDLRARIAQDRATEAALLEQRVTRAATLRLECGGEAGCPLRPR